MTTPQPLESKSAAPRRIGLHRYSVAEFLIALVVAFIGLPFIEPFDKDKHIEAILMALVLVSGVLAACVGLILFGSMASTRADGVVEDVAKSVWDDFGKEAFHYFTIQVIEYGSSQTLNTVSQATDGWGTGTLLGILGENSSGDQTAQLDNISRQITVAQNMITGLKSDRDSFEGSVKQDFQQLAIADAALRLMTVKKSGWACVFPRMPFKTLMPSPSYNEICVFQQLAK